MTREEAIRILASSCIPGSKQTEALETLIPELNESEDERIRKWIIEEFKIHYDFESKSLNPMVEKAIAYLEKQKEEEGYEAIPVESTLEYKLGFKAGKESEKQKEQKPVESISQLTVQGKGVYKICPRCKERMVRDDSMVYTSMPPQYRYECPKCGESECDTVMYDNPEMEEQKPAECKDCAMFLKDKCERPGGKCEKKNQKLSWSEEDEERLKAICTYLQDYPRLAKINDVKRFNEYCDWLKSLHPSWKPSEEQMKALLNAEGKMRETKFIAIASKLAGLYEDLKKLIGEK